MAEQGKRRAVLIAADDYQDAKLCVPAARNDVRELAAVLEDIGYGKADRLVSSTGFLVTKASLRSRIGDFFEQARPGEELLLYFSGHGIEQEGHRLLIPQDYDRRRPPSPTELVGDEDLYRWARSSPARSVLIVIDACREGVKLVLAPEEAIQKAPPGVEDISESDSPTVAIVYSCASREQSWASGGDRGLSYFTRALCETLKREPEAATLDAILDSTQKRLTRTLSEARKPAQTITIDERPIRGRAGRPERLILRESPAAQLRQELDDSPWCEEIRSSSFWPSVTEASPELADRLCVIVARCESEVEEALHRVPEDRWRARDAPARIVRHVERLIRDTHTGLSVAEMALAIAVPYVYEAVLAAGILLLAEDGDPLSPLANEEEASASRSWFAWRSTWLSDEHRLRRHALLVRRGRTAEAQDLVSWHLNRFLHSSGEMWEHLPQAHAGATGWVDGALQRIFSEAPLPERVDPRVDPLLQGRRLVRHARLMFGDWHEIEHVRKNDPKHRLLSDERFGAPPDEWILDEASLAHVLSIAAAMSADPRRLDSVIAEHLGMSPGFDAEALVARFRESAWYADGDRLMLKLECPHEALDLALRNMVESVDEHRRRLDTTIETAARIRESLPRSFSDSWLTASPRNDGEPSYTLPHLQLTLDQRRVFQLLMGKSLYSEHEVALRELYQNAMDACRLRRARVRYAQKTTDRRSLSYDGEIAFRVGADADSRPFIECRDNGIGMGERHLHSFFARAGRRFTDSHEFHVEKAAWAAKDVQFFQNSRFGIGVFSYFMLADEMVVETRRLAPDAVDAEPGLTARIVGGSSLFRIQPNDDLDVGTTIRLYLHRAGGLDELLGSMLEWLWLPELDTTLVDYSGDTLRLEAGQLTADLSQTKVDPIPIAASRDHHGQPRLFWNPRLGWTNPKAILLADGILTEDRSGSSADGLIVNLNGELQPELSVDRSHITSWAKGHEYVVQSLRSSGCRELLGMPGIGLGTLANAFSRWPLPLVLIDRAWRAGALGDDAGDATGSAPESSTSVRRPATFSQRTQDDEVFRRLLTTRVGLAPVLDQILLNNDVSWRPAPADDRRSNEEEPNPLFDGAHAAAIGQWIAARAHALCKSGWDASQPLRMLGRYAAAHDLQDRPSIGLLLVSRDRSPVLSTKSISVVRMLQISEEWSLTLDEVKYLIRPFAELGVSLPDLDALPAVIDLRGPIQRLLSRASQSDVEGISICGILSAAFELSIPLSQLPELLAPLVDLGIAVPSLESLTALPDPTVAQMRVLDFVLLRARGDDGLPRALLDAIGELGETDVVDLARWLAELGAPVAQILPFLQSEPLRILASQELDGRAPWVYSLSKWDVLERAARLSMSLGEVQDLVSELGTVGIPFHGEAFPSLDFRPTEQHMHLIGKWPKRETFVEPMLELAAERGMKWADVMELAEPLKDLDVPIPEAAHVAPDFVPEERHLLLLSQNLDGKYLRAEGITAGRLVAAAIEWSVPLGEVVELTRQLAAVGVPVPDTEGFPMGFRPTEQHALVLSREMNGKAPWLDSVPRGQLLAAASTARLTLDELAEVSRPLVEIGVTAPLPPVSPDLVSRDEVLAFLSADLDRRDPWIDEATPLHILRACIQWSKPWGEVVAFAEELGILPAGSPALVPEAQTFRPVQRHLQILFQDLSRGSVSQLEPKLGHLFLAATRWNLKLAEIVQLLRPLELVGIVSMPELDDEHLDFPVSERHLILLSQDLDGLPEWTEELTLRQMQVAAKWLTWPLSRVLETALPLNDLGIELPTVPDRLQGHRDRTYELLDSLRPYQSAILPWEIAMIATRRQVPVSEYAEALEVVAAMGVDVEEARAFVTFSERDSTSERETTG